MKLSFVIPCYNSEKTISDVVKELTEKLAERPEFDYEIITVNDGSKDGVWGVLEELASKDEHIKAIDLAVNTGKPVAQIAGYNHVTGDLVIGLDDDGQCPVDRLWDLLEPFDKGYDVVVAQYPQKEQSAFKNFGSRINDRLSEILYGKPKEIIFSNFIARKRFIIDEMIKFHNPNTKLDSLNLKITKRIASVPMEERPRAKGKSGYNFIRSLKLLMDGCFGYSAVPMRVSYLASFLNALLAVVFTVVSIVSFVGGACNYAWLVIMFMFYIGAVVLFFVGLVGEYIARSFISDNIPQFVIREKRNIH